MIGLELRDPSCGQNWQQQKSENYSSPSFRVPELFANFRWLWANVGQQNNQD
jgi:hypothetical protein